MTGAAFVAVLSHLLAMARSAFAYDKHSPKAMRIEQKMVPKQLHRIPLETLAAVMMKEQVVLSTGNFIPSGLRYF